MSYFKKFCDLVGGIGAFFAAVFVIGKYMEYDPKDLEEGQSKLKVFFSAENASEYRQYLVFIALIALAIAVGLVFRKLPWLSLTVSVLPMCQAMSMLYRALFYENGFFYVAVSAILLCGSFYEAVSFDKAHGKARTALAARIIALLGAAFAGLSIKLSSFATQLNEVFLSEEGLAEEQLRLVSDAKAFGIMLLSEVPEKEIKALIFFAVALVLCVVIGVLVRRAYFVEAIFSFVPFAFSVSALHAEKITTLPMVVVVPAAVYFIACLTLTFTSKE